MKPIWTLTLKDLRLLWRDPRAVVILLAMPLIFILVLGVSLGEGFGKKAADQLRVSVLNLDRGPPRFFDRPAMTREAVSWLSVTPGVTGPAQLHCGLSLFHVNRQAWFPHESWAEVVLRDLAQTADIKVELIADRAEADALVRSGRRAAVLMLGPNFSKRVSRCSFLAGGWQETLAFSCVLPRPGLPTSLALTALFNESQDQLPLYLLDGLNPFHRDGIKFETLEVEVLRDPTQEMAARIIDQVAQGSLARVVMPWMIGRAFDKIADPSFLALLSKEEELPGPVKFFLTNPLVSSQQKQALSFGLKNSLQNLFFRYNLTGKTWAALTKETEHGDEGAQTTRFQEDGKGWLRRGGLRYQLLVPSYLVMFAFFLVLTVGWLFVAERRQGTMKRLCAAPLTRSQILLGKLLPCLLLSVGQGLFLLLAGKILFAMSWGPAPGWLVPVVVTTSLAAMGLAMLVAALAYTEAQVAIYGTLLVLVLAGLSGCLMGDRALMPETMQQISRCTPHAWALDAYKQLLANPANPNLQAVALACGVLTAFGLGFLALAWWSMKLE